MALISGKQTRQDSIGIDRIKDDGSQGTLLFGAGTVIGVTDSPSASTDLANKSYVDSVAAGLDPKESVRFATTDDIGGTYNSTGGSGGTGEFTGVDLTDGTNFDLDGNTVAVGDRILVKDQTADTENGIYVVTTDGATGVIERADDHDGSPSGEVSGGNFVFVELGASLATTGWVLQGDGTLTLNTDSIVWSQFSESTSFTGGDGIDISGQTISVDLATNSGLTFSTGQLLVDTGDGLDINGTTGVLDVDVTDFIDTSSGLTETSNDIQVKLESDGGLAFDGTNGGIEVTPDSTTGATVAPVAVGTNGVGVTVDNSTITHSTGTLSVGSITSTEVSDFDEAAQDAVGTILTDTNSINFTYDDGTPQITADLTVDTTGGANLATVLDINTNGVAVRVDDATIEDDGNGATAQLRVKADGINDTHIDFGSGANQVNATDIPLDTGGTYGGSATNVQDALEELESDIAAIDTATFNTGATDKDQSPTTTSGDEAQTGVTIASTPDGYVLVFVNGQLQNLTGDKLGDCYFSADGGTTARALTSIVSGDELIWNGNNAGFDLDNTNDKVTLAYEV